MNLFDDEDEVVPLDDDCDDELIVSESEHSPDDMKVGSFVLAKFDGKKKSVCYVGQVLSKEDPELESNFYRKSENLLIFKKPLSGDIKYIDKSQVVQMFPDPIFTGKTAKIFGSGKFECAFDTEHEVA